MKISDFLKEDLEFNFAIEDFTKAVIESLRKRAERVYRKSGEPWDSRINELEKQYLDSLQVDDLRNWVRFSYLPYKDQRRALFFVLKSDTQKFKAGDIFEPNMQQRPDTTRNPIANVLDPESYLFMTPGY